MDNSADTEQLKPHRPQRRPWPVSGLGEHSSSFGERGITKRLTALSRHAPLRGGRLLDVGCAGGSYTIRLAAGFDAVDAIDVEPGRLDTFHAAIAGTDLASRIRIQRMSADALAYGNGTFDAATAIEVLEHIPDLDATIREVGRVLKPGGRFFVTTPNRYFPFETHGVLWRGNRFPPTRAPFLPWLPSLHRRLSDARAFTARQLTLQMREHGFQRDALGYIMPPFDRSAVGRKIRPVTDALERSRLRVFGMALVLVFTKRVTTRLE